MCWSVESKYLWQFTEVPGSDVPTYALVGVLHVLTYISECIGSSQQREELVLLGLVVHNLRLRVSAEDFKRKQKCKTTNTQYSVVEA